MAVILLIKTEDGQVSELPVLNKVVMGRSSSSDYKIVDSKMSSKHCSFEVTGKGEVLFCDLGSTNGSYINNSQVHQTYVRINDVIRIGNTLIKIDDKRLSPSERLAIGSTQLRNKNDKTLPALGSLRPNGTNSVDNPERPGELKGESPKKKTVVLGKNIKDKKRPVNHWAGSADTVLEQEESTGHTKFLKLDKDKTKKKP